MKKKKQKSFETASPIVSGTFQPSEKTRTEDLKEMKNEQPIDEESLYYARQFMED